MSRMNSFSKWLIFSATWKRQKKTIRRRRRIKHLHPYNFNKNDHSPENMLKFCHFYTLCIREPKIKKKTQRPNKRRNNHWTKNRSYTIYLQWCHLFSPFECCLLLTTVMHIFISYMVLVFFFFILNEDKRNFIHTCM